MEEMKTFECAICGKLHKTIEERSACEIKCLEDEKYFQKKLNEEAKEKAKKETIAAINKEIDVLMVQYDKVVKMVNDFYKKYDNEDIYDKVTTRYIPKTFFDFIF